MSAAGFILAINLSVASLFAAAFAWVAAFARTEASVTRPALWFCTAFLLGAANFAVEWSVSIAANPRLVVALAFSLMLAAFTCFVLGLAEKYQRHFPIPVLVATFIASVVLNLAIYDMPRHSFLRVLLYQAPYTVMVGYAALVVWSSRTRRVLDTVLLVFLAMTALHFLSKPVLAAIYGVGANPQDYVNSVYALISQTSGAVLLVACGLLMIAVLMRDMLFRAAEISETDQLSGLLNRRGFEDRAVPIARSLARRGLPGAVVICDLDHFKQINDTFGHAVGDRVIAAFAEVLRSSISEKDIAARIGGEEFAVLLKAAHPAAARLFAEGVRSVFSSLPIEGLPEDRRFTASFGIAEIRAGDGFSDMMRRADTALYAAKAAGRDCVRLHDGQDEALMRGGSRAMRG